MSEDGVSFIDAEGMAGYGNKDEVSFRSIIMEHIRRIAVAGSQEWHGGYNKIKSNTVGGTIMEYVPDSREVYINSIRQLADLLLPHFDNEMFTAEEKITVDLEKAMENLRTEHENMTRDEREKINWKENRKKIKVKHNRRLFRELSKFLNRVNYLESVNIEE